MGRFHDLSVLWALALAVLNTAFDVFGQFLGTKLNAEKSNISLSALEKNFLTRRVNRE